MDNYELISDKIYKAKLILKNNNILLSGYVINFENINNCIYLPIKKEYINNTIYCEYEVYKIIMSDDMLLIKVYVNTLMNRQTIINIMVDESSSDNIINYIRNTNIYFPDIVLHRSSNIKYNYNIHIPNKKSYKLFKHIIGIPCIWDEINKYIYKDDILALSRCNKKISRNVLRNIVIKFDLNSIVDKIKKFGINSYSIINYVSYKPIDILLRLLSQINSNTDIIEKYMESISILYNKLSIYDKTNILQNILCDKKINIRNLKYLIAPMLYNSIKFQDKLFIYLRTLIEIGYTELYNDIMNVKHDIRLHIKHKMKMRLSSAKTADYLIAKRLPNAAMNFVSLNLFCIEKYTDLISMLITFGYYNSVDIVLNKLNDVKQYDIKHIIRFRDTLTRFRNKLYNQEYNNIYNKKINLRKDNILKITKIINYIDADCLGCNKLII